MKDQNFANHIRFVPGFHFAAGGLLLIGTIASLINVYFQIATRDSVLGSILIATLFIIGILLFLFTRRFAVTVQDRAIRAEESLRFYILTNKRLDTKLTKAQIIALRFAPDDEFLVLADRAIRENLSAAEIKKLIKNWKADNDRA